MLWKKLYIYLGAGFSRPLGLPLMSDFLIKAKDMYFSSPSTFSYIKDVIQMINELSVVKNYFKSDLFNIEEILSILEMNDYLGDQSNKELFQRFICSVIEYYTPEIKYNNLNP